MLDVGLALLVLAVAGGVTLTLRRRPGHRRLHASRPARLSAGVRHLASTVNDLSDLRIQAPSGDRVRRRRLGAMLDLR